MRGLKLAGLAIVGALLLGGCFNGNGSYPVWSTVAHDSMGGGLWHSSGGPTCAWHSSTNQRTQPLPDGVGAPYAGPRYADLSVLTVHFDTSGCGPWVQADGPFDTLHPTNAYGVLAGDGDYRVGVEVPAGRYQSTATTDCTWQRRLDFSGLPGNVIASGTGGVVDIAATDGGFSTQSCGLWRRIG